MRTFIALIKARPVIVISFLLGLVVVVVSVVIAATAATAPSHFTLRFGMGLSGLALIVGMIDDSH